MKVIIRDLSIGLYLTKEATWTKFKSEAVQFDNSIAALEFCVTNKIHDIELLVLMNDPRLDTPLPLFPHGGKPAVFPVEASHC